MFDTKLKLHETSIPVGVNIPVTFVRAAYKHGKSFKTKDPWFSLDFIFHHADDDGEDQYLVHKAFQPAADKYFDKIDYATMLSEILNSLAGKDLWSEIRGCRDSWPKFYTEYLKAIDKFRKNDVYVKTVACPFWKDREYYVACLAENNFISRTDNLSYTYLEKNEVEDFISGNHNNLYDSVQAEYSGNDLSNFRKIENVDIDNAGIRSALMAERNEGSKEASETITKRVIDF